MLLPIFTKSTLIFTKSVMTKYFKSFLVYIYWKMKQKLAIFRINDYFCPH